MKQWGAVFTTVIILLWIALILLVSTPANANEAKEQALCVTEKQMAENIQFTRITTHDSLELYTKIITIRSKPGKPQGHAQTPEQIAIKDRFWQKNLKLAARVYALPIGWSPEYAGNYMLKLCQWGFEVQRWRDEKVQKFDV